MNTMVSVILPVYNRYDLLGQTLDTVLEQTYSDWECIVVDDRSDDYICELMEFYCERDPRIRFFKRPEDIPKGVSSCRNYGFKNSTGKFINWFDSDDLMHKELLEKKVNLLAQSSAADYCLSSMAAFRIIEGKIDVLRTTNVDFSSLWKDFVLRRFAAGTPSVLWKREILIKQNKLFDESLSHSEDLELYSRIFFSNDRVKVIHEPLILFRDHEESLSGGFLKGKHLDSFLEVRKRIIDLANGDKQIGRHTLISVLDTFRTHLSHKNYKGCEECLSFIDANNKNQSLFFRLSLMRVRLFYQVFKRAGRGETRFRRLLKIK
ncbi:MAG: glycosyltransferase family 2 protein [Christiangramia sp.]|uniref:glycosyltransferase family 2 protein n=1 Tax=Christiangramia sp. TaxID=1931228 RepID=UPI003242AE33